MISIKICGITSANDANMAIEIGCSAIGLIFYQLTTMAERFLLRRHSKGFQDAGI